jgi:hypothetical protein
MELFDEDQIPEFQEDNDRKRKFQPQTTGSADNVTTPDWLLDYVMQEFPMITSDPCPQEPEQDGLAVEWDAWSFVNPPCSECQTWVEKAVSEAKNGHFSVMLIPATFNSVYWREIVLKNATEIRIFACPIRFDGQKKQVVTQMALVVFAAQYGNGGVPLISVIEPTGWQAHYYKRKRNMARFSGQGA